MDRLDAVILESRVAQLQDECLALTADVERLSAALDTTISQRDEWLQKEGEERDKWQARAEKAEAENERLRGLLREAKEDWLDSFLTDEIYTHWPQSVKGYDAFLERIEKALEVE